MLEPGVDRNDTAWTGDGAAHRAILALEVEGKLSTPHAIKLVAHLEQLGYVERVPDSSDRRAKLVRATRKGKELYAIAREVVAEVEAEWTERLGKAKMRQLRELLEELNADL